MADKPLSPGAALVKRRWDKTTAKQRSDHARMMARARWGKSTGISTGSVPDTNSGGESAPEPDRTEPDSTG